MSAVDNWSCGEIRQIQQIVSAYFKVPVTDILSIRRDKNSVIPRHIAMWLCRRLTHASFPKIGRAFRRDHTTIMHGVANAQTIIYKSPELMKTVTGIMERWHADHN